ncbi:hypothetical protein [Zunongwangia sp. HRR-M8]|uniref:hypothetical protein n=1 Tax=Zunongwangia sp. HRR-M8 TaxID=3015170 RepID=UPI0022DE5DEC|nr:hypothetical protein [Zunongwangia sp. HRR-M8]WBL21239.1 hypothetical protein PBT89_10885 [Zunongwangia sp. HRR-M8]
MRRSLLFFLLLSVLFSCTEDGNEVVANSQIKLESACTAEDPLAIGWMQDLKQKLDCGEFSCEVSIIKSEYEGETVFYIQMIDPLCYGFDEITLYSCTGKKVESFTIEESREFVNSPGREIEEIFICND